MCKNNKCYRCYYFERYYTKGLKSFNMTDIGLCTKKKEIIQKNEHCEEFCLKRSGHHRRIVAVRCLNDLLTELSELRKLIEADKTENEEL